MRGDREAGFTLLEVLVAFVIALIAVVVLYRGATDGLLTTRIADRYQEAVSRARSHLDEICAAAPLRPMETSGDDGGGFRWRLRIRQVGQALIGAPGGAAPLTGTPPARIGLYAVDVAISWPRTGPARTVQLDTECLGTAPASALLNGAGRRRASPCSRCWSRWPCSGCCWRC